MKEILNEKKREKWFERMFNVSEIQECLRADKKQLSVGWTTLITASYQYSGLSPSCRFALFLSSGARRHTGLFCRHFDKLHHILITFHSGPMGCSSGTWIPEDSSLQHSFTKLLLSSAPHFSFVKLCICLRGGLESCICNKLSRN